MAATITVAASYTTSGGTTQFQVEPVPGGLQVNAATPGAAPATWVVMTR
jgi:hypothetical protein